MSLLDRLAGTRAPKELAADERTQGPRCTACHATDTELEPKMLGDFGAQPTCKDETPCLDRVGYVRRWW